MERGYGNQSEAGKEEKVNFFLKRVGMDSEFER